MTSIPEHLSPGKFLSNVRHCFSLQQYITLRLWTLVCFFIREDWFLNSFRFLCTIHHIFYYKFQPDIWPTNNSNYSVNIKSNLHFLKEGGGVNVSRQMSDSHSPDTYYLLLLWHFLWFLNFGLSNFWPTHFFTLKLINKTLPTGYVHFCYFFFFVLALASTVPPKGQLSSGWFPTHSTVGTWPLSQIPGPHRVHSSSSVQGIFSLSLNWCKRPLAYKDFFLDFRNGK